MPTPRQGKSEPKTVVFNIRLTEDMVTALRLVGSWNERTAAAEARLAIRNHLKKAKAA